ncbi:divergent polysaccharide deacetylase family protein [Escherichia coli]
MQKVMQALERYNLYFLDSVTIGSTQATRAAQGTGVKVIKRKVFLDDSQNEADIRVQLIAQLIWRVATVQPLPLGILTLQRYACYNRWFYSLPPDITLVKASSLLNELQVDSSHRRRRCA